VLRDNEPIERQQRVRVTTLFNRVLGLAGASAVGVQLTSGGLVIDISPRRRVYRCPCGFTTTSHYDQTTRTWRHLDLVVTRVWLRAQLVRIWCPHCELVVTENVSWARPRARFTRDFEDTVAWLAQRMDKTGLARLMRSSWETVDKIVARVVADQLDDSRLHGLYRIGVDEISYRRGHKYLTVVVDHDTGNVVWVGQGRSAASLQEFYTALGPDRCAQLEAVSMDASAAYISATESHAGDAAICIDGFHVIAWANEAVDKTLANARVAELKDQFRAENGTRAWRQARTVLRYAKERLSEQHHKILAVLRRERRELFRAWSLKEELRDLYRIVRPRHAADYLTRWIRKARRSKIPSMMVLADKIARVFDGIIAALTHGLSNGRSEGTNTKIRAIQRRGYGYHGPEALAAMIYLCCSRIKINLPTES
jgi:transposase